jgi:hypothetical protein
MKLAANTPFQSEVKKNKLARVGLAMAVKNLNDWGHIAMPAISVPEFSWMRPASILCGFDATRRGYLA